MNHDRRGVEQVEARQAGIGDLHQLLALFAASPVSQSAQPLERAQAIWAETLAQPGLHVFVAGPAERIVSTCMLVTTPNLLRAGRRHAFLENVVTHPDWQGKGFGTAVVQAALRCAWSVDCYHVLLQSGRQDPRVHRFYQRLGFVPGLRTAYAARPANLAIE